VTRTRRATVHNCFISGLALCMKPAGWGTYEVYGTEEMERMRVRMSVFSAAFCVFVVAGDVGDDFGNNEDVCGCGALEDLIHLYGYLRLSGRSDPPKIGPNWYCFKAIKAHLRLHRHGGFLITWGSLGNLAARITAL